MHPFIAGAVATASLFVVWFVVDLILVRAYKRNDDITFSRIIWTCFVGCMWLFVLCWSCAEMSKYERGQPPTCSWTSTTINGVNIIQCVYTQ